MTPELLVLTGSQAGRRLTIDRMIATVGRAPDSTLQFDPEQERMVSATHAILELIDGRWHIRDSDSLNGTYVNGQRVTRAPLRSGDRLRFGADGPQVEFKLRGDPAVAADSRKGRRAALAVGTFVIALTAIVFAAQQIVHQFEMRRLRARAEGELALAERRSAELEGRIAELATALRASKDAVVDLRAQLRDARRAGDDTRVAQLEGRLQDLTAELTRLRYVASLDFEEIRARNEDAVAVLYAEVERGRTATGTAFAVRPDGTLITSRHLVVGASGERPLRLAVQFARSDQVFRARLISFAQDLDVAVVKVDDILGDVPTIAGIAGEPPAAGEAVAVIGFPLGGSGAVGSAPTFPRPVISAGMVTRSEVARFEFDGYGAAGASGSPIFREDGLLVGVLYGGNGQGAGSRVVGVPANYVVELLSVIGDRTAPRSD